MTRADDLKKFLAGARAKGESYKAYCRRRKLAAVSVKQVLAGRLAFDSSPTNRPTGTTYRKADANTAS